MLPSNLSGDPIVFSNHPTACCDLMSPAACCLLPCVTLPCQVICLTTALTYRCTYR